MTANQKAEINKVRMLESKPSFERLFNPQTVAVIGASINKRSIGGQVLKNLRHSKYHGQIYPINPKYDEIDGLRCYPSIDALPDATDLLVVAVPAGHVPEVIRDAGRKGISFAIILASGFAETGVTGEAAQQALLLEADRAGIQLIGPNCQGLMNITDGIHIGFGVPYSLEYRKGNTSLTSQSGAFGNSLVMGLADAGIGLRCYVSTGNEAVTTSLDLIEYLLDDPESRVIAGYVEGFHDAHRLASIGRKALALNKPLVLWKVGNSVAGARAAASHTANLAGGASFYYAAFRQFGIVRVEDIDEMADCVKALSTGRRARGNRVGIVTISGGAGIVMADRCSELGLSVGEFSDYTIEKLRPNLPEYASLANPLDVTAGAINNPDGLICALQTVITDSSVDMLALALAATSGQAGIIAAKAIVLLAEQTDRPILVAWNAPLSLNVDAYRILADAGIPVYGSPVRCARGLGAIWELSAAQLHQPTCNKITPISRSKVVGERWGLLNEFNSKKLLQDYGLPITREQVATDEDVAVSFAREIGFPVVMKLLSADIPHKSDLGGVKIDLRDEGAVREAYKELALAAARRAGSAHVEGVLVQELVRTGVEVILGAVVDPSFGPMVMVGSGGIYAETFKDVTFRMAPLTRYDAEAMIAETRVYRLLRGVRGQKPADINALIDALVLVSDLVVEQADNLIDIDINPLFVLQEGSGVLAADAVVRFKSRLNE